MEWFKKLLENIKKIWGKLSTVKRIGLLSIVGVVVLLIVLMVVFSSSPSMVPLIGTPVTDENQLSRIVTRLDQEIPNQYKVSDDNIIMVADEKTARRMHMVLMRDDLLPRVDPWEIFDMEKWTLTDFERKVNLRRAIQTNIEQHIQSLEDVDAVSVIIDLPKDTLFTEDQKPYTASVKITPKPGSDIQDNRSKIEGIEKLIMLAVSGLTHENVVITDHYGNILNDFERYNSAEKLNVVKRQLDQKAQLEDQYTRKILQGLREIFSDDRVAILKLDIDLDFSEETSTTREHFPVTVREDNPETPYDDSELKDSILVSSQTHTEHFQGTGFVPEGPPGSEGQTAPEYKDLSNLVGKYDKELETSNYNVNETNRARTERPWNIGRITVGVALDGYWEIQYDDRGGVLFEENNNLKVKRLYVPVADEELKKAETIIKDAIGYSQARKDSVSVEHLAFDRREQFYQEDDKYRKQKQMADTIMWVLIGVGAIAAASVLFRITSRYLERKRREKEEELARQHQAMREAALRSAEEQGVDVELSVEERARMEMQENAINMAREHPEDVAQLIRTWLLEE